MPEGNSLWVGGLPDDIKEHELVDTFSKFGNIRSVVIRKNTKDIFAFVNFEDGSSSSIDEAIRTMHNVKVFGSQPIKVNHVFPKKDRHHDDDRAEGSRSPLQRTRARRDHDGGSGDEDEREGRKKETNSLWIGSLPPDIREEELAELFEVYGRIKKVKTFKKGEEAYAFVDFEDGAQIEEAIKEKHDQKIYGSKAIKVNHAYGKKEYERNDRREGGGYREGGGHDRRWENPPRRDDRDDGRDRSRSPLVRKPKRFPEKARPETNRGRPEDRGYRQRSASPAEESPSPSQSASRSPSVRKPAPRRKERPASPSQSSNADEQSPPPERGQRKEDSEPPVRPPPREPPVAPAAKQAKVDPLLGRQKQLETLLQKRINELEKENNALKRKAKSILAVGGPLMDRARSELDELRETIIALEKF